MIGSEGAPLGSDCRRNFAAASRTPAAQTDPPNESSIPTNVNQERREEEEVKKRKEKRREENGEKQKRGEEERKRREEGKQSRRRSRRKPLSYFLLTFSFFSSPTLRYPFLWRLSQFGKVEQIFIRSTNALRRNRNQSKTIIFTSTVLLISVLMFSYYRNWIDVSSGRRAIYFALSKLSLI